MVNVNDFSAHSDNDVIALTAIAHRDASGVLCQPEGLI